MAAASQSSPPLVLHEDQCLLVINKPAGMNTHAPSLYAGEGIYDWLKHREPRWAQLAIIHRLDKETTGVIVFGKTATANRSLTEQFTERKVRKKYLLLTDRSVPQTEFVVRSKILRAGDRYVSGALGEPAETHFQRVNFPSPMPGLTCLEAEPLTGRTHQIRVHAAENGFPILGDRLYGGKEFPRVCLHAAEIRFSHPTEGREVSFIAPAEFFADSRMLLRNAVIDLESTDAFRRIHSVGDGWPGWYVEQLGDYLLSQSEQSLTVDQLSWLKQQVEKGAASKPGVRPMRGVYHKVLNRQVRRSVAEDASPKLICGMAAPERFIVRENGVQFELSFTEGYSVGLFLDQRENRRRVLTGHIGAGFDLEPMVDGASGRMEVLNAFAYTCGFSVCAAKAGARTTSLDLSKKYLEWGRRNFALNGIDPERHDFIFGDAFDWMRRLAKKSRLFDLIVLDPPTFSQSKEGGAFRVEKDFGRLVSAALPLLKSQGVLLASSNTAGWLPEKFLDAVMAALRAAKRTVVQQYYVPQPPDFPISREEPGYLKTCWWRIV